MADHYSGDLPDEEALEEAAPNAGSWMFRLAPSRLGWFLALGALFWTAALLGLAFPFLYRAGGEILGLPTFREGAWPLFDALAAAREQGRHLPA